MGKINKIKKNQVVKQYQTYYLIKYVKITLNQVQYIQLIIIIKIHRFKSKIMNKQIIITLTCSIFLMGLGISGIICCIFLLMLGINRYIVKKQRDQIRTIKGILTEMRDKWQIYRTKQMYNKTINKIEEIHMNKPSQHLSPQQNRQQSSQQLYKELIENYIRTNKKLMLDIHAYCQIKLFSADTFNNFKSIQFQFSNLLSLLDCLSKQIEFNRSMTQMQFPNLRIINKLNQILSYTRDKQNIIDFLTNYDSQYQKDESNLHTNFIKMIRQSLITTDIDKIKQAIQIIDCKIYEHTKKEEKFTQINEKKLNTIIYEINKNISMDMNKQQVGRQRQKVTETNKLDYDPKQFKSKLNDLLQKNIMEQRLKRQSRSIPNQNQNEAQIQIKPNQVYQIQQ